jgi:hypothetical protein
LAVFDILLVVLLDIILIILFPPQVNTMGSEGEVFLAD